MEELSLQDLIVPLKRYWLFIVISTVVVTVGILAYTHFIVPTSWETDTSIVFEASSGAGLGWLRDFGGGMQLGGQLGGRGEFLEFLLNSRRVRGGVVDRLNLIEELEAERRADAIKWLETACEVHLPTTKVLVLTVRWTGKPRAAIGSGVDPASEMASRVAKAMIASLEEEVSRNDYTEAARERKMLEEQLQRATEELLEAEDKLVDYATSEGLISPSDQQGAVVDELEALQRREGELQTELEEAQARKQTARQRLTDQDRMVVTGLSERRDPAIDRLRQRILDLQQSIAEQKEVQGKSESHPDVASLLSELESAEAQLAEVMKADMQVSGRGFSVDPSYGTLVREALDNELRVSGIRAAIDAVRSRKRAAITEVQRFPAKSTHYQRLQRQVTIKSGTVERLTESYETARIREATSQTSFSIVDEAIPPMKPSGPSLKKTGAVAFAASLLFAVLLAFWRHGRIEAAREEDPTTQSGLT